MINFDTKNKKSILKNNELEENIDEIIGFDVTSMLDVVFVMLVFFIVIAGASQSIFKMKLSEADKSFSSEKSENSSIKISIFENGKYAVGSTICSNYEAFRAELFKANQKIDTLNKSSTLFLVIPEKNVSAERLMKVLSFMKSEKMTNVDILLDKVSR